MGHWSPVLGVQGVAEADGLRALVDGCDPVSGASLLAGLRERTVKAFDLTFSAPKAASLLWALGSERVADVVMGAHREAVAAALGFLEDRAALARIQVDGLRCHVRTDGWAPETRSCTPIVWCPTSCVVRTVGVWRSPPARCSCGPAPPGRSIKPSCNGY